METEGKILKETCSTIRSILVVLCTFIMTRLGFVLDLWLKFLLRSCEEDLAAAVREREAFLSKDSNTHR